MITKTIKNEQGFVLIVSLLMLVVLMIIGIAATNTTTLELQISGNDKVSKQTFYQADGGTQVGAELVEDSIDRSGYANDGFAVGPVTVQHRDFYLNDATTVPAPDWNNPDATMQQTSLIFRGATEITPGSAIQMVAGYEGKGKASASGGAVRIYDIWSRHSGDANSDATVVIEWNHRL